MRRETTSLCPRVSVAVPTQSVICSLLHVSVQSSEPHVHAPQRSRHPCPIKTVAGEKVL